jgi:hypothetical protein
VPGWYRFRAGSGGCEGLPGKGARNRGQNTDSAKILEYIIYGLFFLYTGASWLTRMYLSFAHTLDFVFEVLSAQHPFLVQGFTNCMDLPMIPRPAK